MVLFAVNSAILAEVKGLFTSIVLADASLPFHPLPLLLSYSHCASLNINANSSTLSAPPSHRVPLPGLKAECPAPTQTRTVIQEEHVVSGADERPEDVGPSREKAYRTTIVGLSPRGGRSWNQDQ